MDNATRRQILERVKQLGYPNTIEALRNPQVLDQYEQQLQAQSQQQQQQPVQQQPVTFPTPPATTPNYKIPQPAQSEAKPLVMSFNQTAPQLMKTGGSKFKDGGFFTDPPPKKVEPTLPVVQAQALSTAINPTGAEIFTRDNALQVAENLNTLPENPPENPPAYYPSDAYISGLRLQENAGKSGFNKNNNKWYSHASVEGGTNTIAYGHKLTKEEAAKGIYSKGITEEQANELLKKDLEHHLNNTKKIFNSKYGENAFDKVPNELKDVLVDYSYNGVLNKFNNFTQGVYNYSTATTPEQKELAHQQMLKEYQRKAGDKLLTSRNTWTKGMLESVPTRKYGGIKFDKGGPKDEETGELETEALRNKFYQTAPNLQKLYANLNAEKERVAKVRANVPIEADKLDKGDDFMYSDYIEEHPEEAEKVEKNKQLYNAYLTAKNPKDLEIARQNLPLEIRNLLINDGKYNVATWDASTQKWNPNATPERELYCTPYGCYTYRLAGATDVPIVPGNMGFVDMVRTGKLPFEKVSDPEKGDVGILIGAAPRAYTKPELGNTIRPHHTVIYDSTDANGNINAYNANNGARLNYLKSNIQLEPDVANSPMKSMEYYRYVGDTNKLQKQIDAEYKAHPELLDIENQIKLKQEQIKNQPIQTIKPLDMKPIRVSKQETEALSLKKYGGKKCYTCNSSKMKVLYNKANYKK